MPRPRAPSLAPADDGRLADLDRRGSGGTGLNKEINLAIFQKQVGLKDLAIMSRQMATMVSSGLSLLRCLGILTEQAENKTLQTVLASVTQGCRVRHVALRRDGASTPTVFPPIMVNLVRAGETGGFLDDALEYGREELRVRGEAARHDQVGDVLPDHRAHHGGRCRGRHAAVHRAGLQEHVRGLRRGAAAAHADAG